MYEIFLSISLFVVLMLVLMTWKKVAKTATFWVFAVLLGASFYYNLRTSLEFAFACEDWLALQQGYFDADRNTLYQVIAQSPEPVISLTRIESTDQMGELAQRKPDIEQWLSEQEEEFSRAFGDNPAPREAYRWSWAVEGRIREACAAQLAEPRRRVDYYPLWSKAEIRAWFRQWRDETGARS